MEEKLVDELCLNDFILNTKKEEKESINNVNIIEYTNEDSGDSLVYPCFIIQNVTTLEECKILGRKEKRGMSFHLFVTLDGYHKCIGYLNWNIEDFLKINSVSNYVLSFYQDYDKCITIDLDNPETYIKIIHL